MYIEQRRRRWYAVLDIPIALRPHFEKKRFVQSLKTDSQQEAERRVLPLIAHWKSLIAEASSDSPLDRDVSYWREALKQTSDNTAELFEEHGPSRSDKDILRDYLEDKARKLDKKSKGTGAEFFDRVTGSKTGTCEYLERWYASLTDAPKTKDMKRTAVKKLAKTLPTLQQITRKKVYIWAQAQVIENGLNPKTVMRDLSFLRAYWSYLQAHEAVSEDLFPFDKIKLKANQKQSMQDRRRAFKPTEVVKLLKAAQAKKDQQLIDLISLGMWTGARIDELCSLKTSNVTERSFKVVDAKTESGWREVPIHHQLKPTVDRLLSSSVDGYVLSGLTTGNKYESRSAAIGKRFGRLKSELGFRPKVEVFHSIRKTVTTLLKNAGVPEVIAADIVGHDIPSMTYGLYASEADFEVVREAVESLKYKDSYC